MLRIPNQAWRRSLLFLTIYFVVLLLELLILTSTKTPPWLTKTTQRMQTVVLQMGRHVNPLGIAVSQSPVTLYNTWDKFLFYSSLTHHMIIVLRLSRLWLLPSRRCYDKDLHGLTTRMICQRLNCIDAVYQWYYYRWYGQSTINNLTK